MLTLLTPAATASLTASLDPALADRAERVDIATVSGKFSYAQYHDAATEGGAKPSFPVHTVVPHPVPFGAFELKQGTMHRKGEGHCGYLLPLADGGTVNLLPYRTVTVKGRFSGRWRVAFADEALSAAEENVPVGELPSSGIFPLKDLLLRADLSRSRQLVLLLDSRSGSARVEGVVLAHGETKSAPAPPAIWIWQRERVLGHEEEVLERLLRRKIGTVYLQVGDDPEIFSPFIKRGGAHGIAVYALDGSPGYVTQPQELLSRIERVERYNESHPEARYAGFQTDLEPYLNRDFPSRKGYYAEKYAELVAQIKVRSKLPLSVVVPFWFDTLHTGGRSLVQKIAEHADEVVVMSYRTDKDALLEISASSLSIGEGLGKPVRLGVELAAVPDEDHLELARCAADVPGALRIGSFWWCEARRYTVPGSRISFRSRIGDIDTFLKTPIPFSSFKGWVMHSYEELPL